MKKYILIFGAIFLVLNTLTGLLLSSYELFNVGLVDFNIIISTVLLYLLATSSIDTAYKIALSFIYSVTGLTRIIMSFYSRDSIQDNVLVIIMLGILALEAIIFLTGKYIKRFAD